MTIPDYQTLMRPVLGLVLDKPMHYMDCVGEVAKQFELTDAETEELLPSGVRRVLVDRTYWATAYLKKAGAIERPTRGYVLATEKGRKLYSAHPERITLKVLLQFDEYNESTQGEAGAGDAGIGTFEATPRERLRSAYDAINDALRSELLDAILNASPKFFEQLILKLMQAMNYGGSESGQHLGKTGDGGVDGLINQDLLGLDRVYLQAKRYAPGNMVAVGQIHEFAGALDERGAVKGVFVTTSSFTGPALQAGERSPKRLILIDGEELTRLLVLYNVGVVEDGEPLYVKKLDENYFSE